MYPKELIAELVKLGLKSGATDDEVKAFMAEKNIRWVEATKKIEPIEAQKGEPAKTKKSEDDKAIEVSNEKQAANYERIAAIEALEDVSAEIIAKGIKENWSAEKVELEGLRANRAKSPGIIAKKYEDVNSRILAAGILLKAGYPVPHLEKHIDAKTLERADKHRSLSFKGLIQLCCEMEGKSCPAINASPDEWVMAAFSTSTVSGILSNVANKFLELGFESNDDAAAIMKICKERSLNDLKQNSMYRLFTGSKLPKVPGGGPLQYDELVEGSQTIQADTHGKLIGITRKMILNDDLGAFVAIPEKIGIDAYEQFADDGVYMIENATIFSGGNGNVDTTSQIPSVAGYNAMRLKFAAFTESPTSAKLIGAKPKMVVVPAALFTAAQQMFASQNVIVGNSNKDATATTYVPNGNPFTGNYAVVEITRLSVATTWFGLANPAMIPAFNVGFLNGRKSPVVEEVAVAPEFLGRAWRIVWDYGFAEGDYQGAVRMSTSG